VASKHLAENVRWKQNETENKPRLQEQSLQKSQRNSSHLLHFLVVVMCVHMRGSFDELDVSFCPGVIEEHTSQSSATFAQMLPPPEARL